METTRNVLHVLLVYLGIVRFAVGDCDGNFGVTKEPEGSVQSPNLRKGRENGHTANCTWNFDAPDGDSKYYLKITITDQRLIDQGMRECSRSYNLAVQGADISCKYFIHSTTPLHCMVFYDPNTCKDPSNEETCSRRDQQLSSSVNTKKTSFPVTVTYKSDGKDVGYDIVGFMAKYKFKECEKVSVTTSTSAAVTTRRRALSPVPITTTTTMHRNKVQGKRTKTGDEEGTDPSAPSTMGPSATTLEETTVPIPMGAIIGASAGGGALILILVIVLVVCLYKRKRKASSKECQGLPPNNTATTERGGSDQLGAVDTYDRLGGTVRANQSGAAGTYETLGGGARANQAESADTYDTIDLASGSTQPQPDLYATVSKPQSAYLTEVSMHSTAARPTETKQSESDVYSVVSKPQKVSQPVQSPEEGAVYSAVSIQKQGEKKTVHYNKSME